MKVIIVNGYPRSGKDTFCEFAAEEYECENYSTVDTVKLLATIMGWDGTKTPENRAMLSALKDFTTKWFDMSYNEMVSMINDHITFNTYKLTPLDFIFLHIREPEEIKRMKEWCTQNNVDCSLLCIQREEMVGEQSNHADEKIYYTKYDYYLNNHGTLDEFRVATLDYLDALKNTEK